MVDRAAAFARIYRLNAWNGRDDVRSGPGSTLEATRHLQEQLPKIVADLGITSVLDAGCGDGEWMPDLPGYIGVDVVGWAIERARTLRPDRDYRRLDFVSDELPSVDAVICRDALQHLPVVDGLRALARFRRTGARYLMANTHRGGVNLDVVAGKWYAINLEDSPFSLGPPFVEFHDGLWPNGVDRYPDKLFGAWQL